MTLSGVVYSMCLQCSLLNLRVRVLGRSPAVTGRDKGLSFRSVFSHPSVSLSSCLEFLYNLADLPERRQCGRIMGMFTWVRHINVCIMLAHLSQSASHLTTGGGGGVSDLMVN